MASGDAPQAQRLYRAGMEAYGRKAYEEALSAFDRAIALGDRSWKVQDAKAAAMNKMGGAWRNSAFELSSSLCKKYGDKSARPWYRVASILLDLDLLDAAERSITRGLALAAPDARPPLQDLRAAVRRKRALVAARRDACAVQAAAARKAAMCFTHLLSPDILYLVARSGGADAPLRLAGVCRDWRAAMLAHTSLWRDLRLARRRPAAKAALWMQRAGGRLRRVEITRAVPDADAAAVAAELAPALAHVESITFADLSDPAAGKYAAAWRGQCRALRELRVRAHTMAARLSMFTLLHPDCGTLERVEMTGPHPGALTAHPFGIGPPFPLAPAHLASLRHLVIGQGTLTAQQPWVLALAAAAPRLEHLEVRCTTQCTPADADADDPDPLTLEHLTHLDVCDRLALHQPGETLLTPNLASYSAWNWHARSAPGPPLPVLDVLRSLPRTLTTLDIGRCALDQAALLALLPDFTALRFLNLSFCGVDNTLLEALVTGLLPTLMALSLAGHDSLSAGPLRRLVFSRLGIEPAPARPAARPKSAFAPKRRAPQPKPEPQAQPEPARPRTPITWICVDQCNAMAVDILDALRAHVPFISNHNGALVEDRVRGRGAYAWDVGGADAEAGDCAPAGCHLRKRRRDDGSWYVHHDSTCKAARAER